MISRPQRCEKNRTHSPHSLPLAEKKGEAVHKKEKEVRLVLVGGYSVLVSAEDECSLPGSCYEPQTRLCRSLQIEEMAMDRSCVGKKYGKPVTSARQRG